MRFTRCSQALRSEMLPEPRLATHMIVSALVRQMAEQGDFATVLHKGDAVAGALLLITREKGQNPRGFERFPVPDGSRTWQAIAAQNIDNEEKLSEYLARRLSRDPDLWILELDVASDERLNGLLGQQY
jgi:hypothetical protein